MDHIKKNKSMSVLLVIIIYLYLILFLSGCDKFGAGRENMLNTNNNVALIAESFEDKSFATLSKEGVEEAANKLGLKATYQEVVIDKANDNKDDIVRKISSKNSLIIMVGAPYESVIKKVAREKRIKNFVIVDTVIDEPNVKSIVYKHEEGGFLMGLVAGGETKTNKIGYVGGMDDEDGIKFLSGYAAGAKTVNNDSEKGLLSRECVRFVEGYEDEDRAYSEACQLYDNGCDIIFHTCGKSGLGVFKAAKEKGKKAIGIDRDQSENIEEYKDIIISSMMKNVDESLFEVCKDFVDGSFKSGLINKEELGIKEGGIDYAPSTEKHVSKKTMENLKKYKEKVVKGEIKIPDRMFEVIEFKA